MTREQIMALSGRELDAAIAEHVMGWRNIEVRMFPGALCTLGGNPPGKSWPDMVPDYSTDIAAAWRVVDKFHERYPEISYFDLVSTPDLKNRVFLAKFSVRGRKTHPAATAKSAPEAICKAALLAHFTDARAAKNGGVES